MGKFSERLYELVHPNKEISVYSMAAAIRCNRTWLQKVVSGERSMNYDYIVQMCNYLKKYIGKQQVEELYEMFAEEYFGYREYVNLRYIEQQFKQMKDRERIVLRMAGKKQLLREYLESDAVRESVRPALCAIADMIERGKSHKIYAHFHAGCKELHQLLFCLSGYKETKEKIDFRGIIANGKSTGVQDEERREISGFLTACEYALYGLKTYVLEKNESFGATLLPYYILTENEALLITGDGTSFIQITEIDTVKRFREQFEKLIEGRKYFAETAKNFTYYAHLLTELDEVEDIYSFGNEPSVGLLYSEELFRDYCKKQEKRLEQTEEKDRSKKLQADGSENTTEHLKEAVIEKICERFPKIRLHLMFTQEGLQTSIQDETERITKITGKTKKEMIKQIFQREEKSKVRNLHMLDQNKHAFHEKFAITVASHRLMYFGKDRRMIVNAVVAKYMKNYFLYLSGVDGCMGKEEGMEVLDTILTKKRQI